MNSHLPSAEQIAERLKPLRMSELRVLAHKSGVPFRTLINIRLEKTPNPGIETVRKFFHLLPAAPAAGADAAEEPTPRGVANA